MLLSSVHLPHEGSEKVKEILNSGGTIEEKAKAIYDYDKFLCDMADRRRKPPEMSINIITKILEARKEEKESSPFPPIKFF